jgi:hypothetical protein
VQVVKIEPVFQTVLAVSAALDLDRASPITDVRELDGERTSDLRSICSFM